METYYTADLHLGDKRIIKLCGRPYKSSIEMEESLRSNWNKIVNSADKVYILGDLAYRYRGDLRGYLESLNGKKHLLIGNHDSGWLKNEKVRICFETISEIKKITDRGRSVVMCHYPLAAFDGSLKDGYHVHGHIHNNRFEPLYNAIVKQKRCFNVGVDVNNFSPINLDTLIEKKEGDIGCRL